MIKNFILNVVLRIRSVLFNLNGLPIKGGLSNIEECSVEDPTMDITHGDVIHPCVRYIEEGFEGHHWWMVYTPLYDFNEKLENPRLCYSVAEKGGEPTVWKFYCNITESPQLGYNSDPNIVFHEGKLFVFWRESETENVKDIGACRATYGCYVQLKKVYKLPNPILFEKELYSDKEISPTFICQNGNKKAFCMHLLLHHERILRLPDFLVWLIYRIYEVTDALGIYNRIRCYGVSIWEGTSFNSSFKYVKTIKFDGVSRIYSLWHMDLFEASSLNGNIKNLYAVILNNEKYGDINLACYKDGECFNFIKMPLVTGRNIGKVRLYKPTAQVVDGKFYLFFTAREKSNMKLNKLFVTSIEWSKLPLIIDTEL